MKIIENLINPFTVCIAFVFIFWSFSIEMQEASCGHDRMAVKTLTDSSAKNVNLNPKPFSISELLALPRPHNVNNELPRCTYEFSTYQINCNIKYYFKEPNGNYHLILQDLDDTTKTIVAEILNPDNDLVKKSNYVSKFASARTEFEKCIITDNKTKRGIYKIVGVCFFNKTNNPPGVYRSNGASLYPVTYFLKFK